MNIDWDINPDTGPRVPRRPESPAAAGRSRRRLPSRPHLVVAGAIAVVAAVVGVSVVGFGSAGTDGQRAAAGSRVGHQDPFDVRRAKNLENVWSHDFFSDPTELLVDGDDAFVVTPNEVTTFGTGEGRQRWQAHVKDAEPFIAADLNTVLVSAVDGFEALDRRTGASRWRVGVDDPTDRGRTVALVQSGGAEIAVVATDHGGLAGLDATSGAPVWSVDVDGSPHGRLAVDQKTGSVAFETTDGEHVTLRVLDGATGTVRWTVGLERDTGVGAFVGDLLVLGTGRQVSGNIVAYSVSNGDRAWLTPATDGFEETMAPAIVGKSAIFVDKMGMVISTVAATGKVQWSTKLPGPVLAGSPAVAGGIIVIHDLFAQIHTLDLRTGKLLASRESIGVPIGLGGAPNRIVYAQSQVQYGQVMAYAPELLASRVGRR